MSVFLVVVGALAAAAGLALVVTGASVHESAVAFAGATPGMIAFVGGLLLVGVGLAVRELQRIGSALATRPMPHPARSAEAAGAAAAAASVAGERPAAQTRTAPKAEPRAQPTPTITAAPQAPTEAPAIERLREKFPTLVRLESVAAVEASVSQVTQGRLERTEQEVSEVKRVSVGGNPKVSAPVRAAPRLRASGDPAGAPERPKASVFEAFWPQRQRERRNAATARAPVPAAPPAPPASPPRAGVTAPVEAVEPGLGNEATGALAATAESRPTAAAVGALQAPTPMPAPVSILKSGVVEGMAYALYSDGSIEAQLPQGRLRFGSITELRYHIENDSNVS